MREGFTVWWDAALRSGETFDEVIERELRAAKAVVVLWSPRSVASRWVRAEATLADRRNKLVPAIIEACDLPIIFELTHAADLADWTGDTDDRRWQSLVSDLRRLVDGHHEETARAEAAATKPKAGGSASGKPWPKALEGNDGNQSASEADALMFSGVSMRPGRGNPASAMQAASDDTDETQFCAPSDAFDLFRGDEFHCLQLIDGDAPQSRFVVSPLGLKIGRTAPADIVISGAGISRSHCMVELADDRLRIIDLNSTNGTFIDDERIERSAYLDIGSVLRVGNRSFKHEVHARAEMQLPSEAVAVNPKPNLRVAGLSRFS